MIVQKGIVKTICSPRKIKDRNITDVVIGLKKNQQVRIQFTGEDREMLRDITEGDRVAVTYEQYVNKSRLDNYHDNNQGVSIIKI